MRYKNKQQFRVAGVPSVFKAVSKKSHLQGNLQTYRYFPYNVSI